MTDLNNYYLLLLRVKHVGIHGIEYRPGCVLRLQEMDELGNDYHVYGKVDENIFWEDEKFFILTEVETFFSQSIYGMYKVERTDNRPAVLCHDLPWHGLLHIVQKNGEKFILEKDTSCIKDTL